MNLEEMTDAVDVAEAYRKAYRSQSLRMAINDWIEGSLTDSENWTVKAVLWQLANMW